MNFLLAALRTYLPDSLRDAKIDDLFRLTAAAFGVPGPDIANMTYDEKLRTFATFTRDFVQTVEPAARGDLKQRLYECTFCLGSRLREELKFSSIEDGLIATEILYSAIGISFQPKDDGDVCYRRCYFSAFYSADVCEVISSLDQGIVAGLTNGAELTFSARITEGHPQCLAKIDFTKRTNETGSRGGHRCRWCDGREGTAGRV